MSSRSLLPAFYGYFHLVRRRRAARTARMRRFLAQQRKERLLVAIALCLAAFSLCTVERSIWTKERSSEWWEKIVNGSFTEQEWIDNFRMSKETFIYLCNELRPFLARKNTKMRMAVSTEKRIAMTLWRLATNCDYRTVGHLFGVSRGTVCVIVNEVCHIIVRKMLHRYVRLPTGKELDAVVNGFETKWGFPQCAGAVDGTHIPIVTPTHCGADYYNRKGFHSVIMQAMVDHRYCFTDIYIGWPGRVHDARVFANSELFRKGEDGSLFPNRSRNIGGINVPLLILGDPAYPLLPWLMKPFSDNGKLTDSQKTFNYRLSRARVVVENGFGRLKGRWQCLLKRNDIDLKHLPDCIASCVVLHNLCEAHGERFESTWLTTETSSNREEGPCASGSSLHMSAEAIRRSLMEHICAHPL